MFLCLFIGLCEEDACCVWELFVPSSWYYRLSDERLWIAFELPITILSAT